MCVSGIGLAIFVLVGAWHARPQAATAYGGTAHTCNIDCNACAMRDARWWHWYGCCQHLLVSSQPNHDG